MIFLSMLCVFVVVVLLSLSRFALFVVVSMMTSESDKSCLCMYCSVRSSVNVR